MGMFDYIKIPDRQRPFQTKALESLMHSYGLGDAVPLSVIPVYDEPLKDIERFIHRKDFSFIAYDYDKSGEEEQVSVLVRDGVIVAFGEESDTLHLNEYGNVTYANEGTEAGSAYARWIEASEKESKDSLRFFEEVFDISKIEVQCELCGDGMDKDQRILSYEKYNYYLCEKCEAGD